MRDALRLQRIINRAQTRALNFSLSVSPRKYSARSALQTDLKFTLSTEVLTLNLFVAEEMGKGNAYVAPDSHFISSVSVLADNLPWAKFKKFFDTKSLVSISVEDHLMILVLPQLLHSRPELFSAS